MSRARFHLPADQWSSDTLVLTGDEARHCAQVTRHREGDEVVVFDGAGRRASGRITSLSKDRVEISIASAQRAPEPQPALTLLQAIAKGDSMEWIIEKAVELGVRRIIPVVSTHSVVRLSGADAVKKREKWQRVALEACKQCGQDWLPEIATPCDLASAIALCSEVQHRFVASLQENARGLKELWSRSADTPALSAAVAIGPEGDFSADEYRLLGDTGWRPWTLGVITLRCETAAVCALSILGYELRPA